MILFLDDAERIAQYGDIALNDAISQHMVTSWKFIMKHSDMADLLVHHRPNEIRLLTRDAKAARYFLVKPQGRHEHVRATAEAGDISSAVSNLIQIGKCSLLISTPMSTRLCQIGQEAKQLSIHFATRNSQRRQTVPV